MIKVSYTVKSNARVGYTEDLVKNFKTMADVYKFINLVMRSRSVDGLSVIGVPVIHSN